MKKATTIILLQLSVNAKLDEDGTQRQGRHFFPIDESADDEAGFRLPRIIDAEQKSTAINAGTFAIIIESSDDEESGRSLLPVDASAPNKAGFRLPSFESVPRKAGNENIEVVVVETSEKDDEKEDFVIIDEYTDDSSEREAKQAFDDVIIVSANDEEIDCNAVASPGPCFNEIGSYYYDSVNDKCTYFLYSGCGGNSNRYVNSSFIFPWCQSGNANIDPLGQIGTSTFDDDRYWIYFSKYSLRVIGLRKNSRQNQWNEWDPKKKLFLR